MENKEKFSGIVTTFYSYKGGVGRSMALANLACLMAKEAREPILLIDWGLEAPGLHEYFAAYLPKGHEQKEGLVEFCTAAQKELPAMPLDEEKPELLDAFYSRLGNYVLQLESLPNVFLLKAGCFDKTYGARVAALDWQGFFEKIPSFFSLWAKYLRKNFAYIFIDSRTGHGDAPGISTMLMPEKLVLVFTPNRQSLRGVLELAEKAIHYRRHSDDYRPLMVYPLPSRVELGEDSLRKQWQQDYTRQFEETLRMAYGLPDSISLSNYFDRVQIPHSPRFAYGEEIAVLEEPTQSVNSMALRYVALQQQMFSNKNIWTEKTAQTFKDEPRKVFIVYSREDEQYLSQLRPHLYLLERTGQVKIWNDREVFAGTIWDDEIKKQLQAAEMVLVLVSADSLASDYIWSVEMKTILHRHQLGEVDILPVIVRACRWEQTPIATFQVVPQDGKPVSSFSDRDEAYVQIAEAVSDLATKSRKIPA